MNGSGRVPRRSILGFMGAQDSGSPWGCRNNNGRRADGRIGESVSDGGTVVISLIQKLVELVLPGRVAEVC